MPEGSGTSRRTVDVTVGALLLASTLAGAGLVAVYVLGGQVQLEGALLFVALGCLGAALGLWSRHFMPQGPVEEERPVLESSPEARAAVAADFDRGERTVLNRRILLTMLAGACGAIGAAALVPVRSLGPRILPELRRTAWRDGVRLVDDSGRAVRPEDLRVDTAVTVFPEGADDAARADAQTMLLRLGPGVAVASPGGVGPVEGCVAFSKVCTHAGCPVGLYQAETHQLVCPCHQSVFDVVSGAEPTYGPATRRLPQLPIEVRGGYLVATGDFPEPVGPGFWSMGRS